MLAKQGPNWTWVWIKGLVTSRHRGSGVYTLQSVCECESLLSMSCESVCVWIGECNQNSGVSGCGSECALWEAESGCSAGWEMECDVWVHNMYCRLHMDQ